MLGAEMGTCADTVLATLGRSRAAVLAGLFHLVYNLATASIGLVFASQLVALAAWSVGSGSVARQIANARVLFNVLGAALFLVLMPVAGKLFVRSPRDSQVARSQRVPGERRAHSGPLPVLYPYSLLPTW